MDSSSAPMIRRLQREGTMAISQATGKPRSTVTTVTTVATNRVFHSTLA